MPFWPIENEEEHKQYLLQRAALEQGPGVLQQLVSGLGGGLKSQAEGLYGLVRHPWESFVGIGNAALQAPYHFPAIEHAVKDYLSRSVSSPQDLGQAIGENVGPGELAKVLGMAKAAGLAGMTAYHGSPHKFDRFDISKIGTGEGAQAYGHGLYFAEDPSVAGSYKSALGGKEYLVDGAVVGRYGELDASDNPALALAAARLSDAKNGNGVITQADVDAAIAFQDDIRRRNPGLIPDSKHRANAEAMRGLIGKEVGSRPGGALYHVDIPDEHINNMLDWDAPLSQQPAFAHLIDELDDAKRYVGVDGQVRVSVKTPDGRSEKTFLSPTEAKEYALQNTDGASLYMKLAQRFGSQEKASQFLRSQGIPGIRYLDAGSRNVAFDGKFKYQGKTLSPLGLEHEAKKILGEAGRVEMRDAVSYYETHSRFPDGLSPEVKNILSQVDVPQRTRNFVVFDDSIVKILNRE